MEVDTLQCEEGMCLCSSHKDPKKRSLSKPAHSAVYSMIILLLSLHALKRTLFLVNENDVLDN